MKRSHVILFVLTLLATMTACASAADYTLQTPPGWSKVKGSAAPEHFMKNGISFMLTIDRMPSTTKTPDEYVTYVKKALSGAFKNVKFEPAKRLTINGREARELVYTGEVSGMKMKYDVVYIPVNRSVYTMTVGGLEQGFEAVKGDCSAIFNSFKIP